MSRRGERRRVERATRKRPTTDPHVTVFEDPGDPVRRMLAELAKLAEFHESNAPPRIRAHTDQVVVRMRERLDAIGIDVSDASVAATVCAGALSVLVPLGLAVVEELREDPETNPDQDLSLRAVIASISTAASTCLTACGFREVDPDTEISTVTHESAVLSELDFDDGSAHCTKLAWARSAEDVDVAKQRLHDRLIAEMGDQRIGPVSWQVAEGATALAVLRIITDAEKRSCTKAELDEYGKVETLLRDEGGHLVIASAPGIPPEGTEVLE